MKESAKHQLPDIYTELFNGIISNMMTVLTGCIQITRESFSLLRVYDKIPFFLILINFQYKKAFPFPS